MEAVPDSWERDKLADKARLDHTEVRCSLLAGYSHFCPRHHRLDNAASTVDHPEGAERRVANRPLKVVGAAQTRIQERRKVYHSASVTAAMQIQDTRHTALAA